MDNDALAHAMAPCGPVLDAGAAERVREIAAAAAQTEGWADLLADAWPALAPAFGASHYLAGLVRSEPGRLHRLLAADPQAGLARLLGEAFEAGGQAPEDGARRLRHAKAELHLLTALADLGRVWDLDQVTAALSRFADAAVDAALRLAAREGVERGRLVLRLASRPPRISCWVWT